MCYKNILLTGFSGVVGRAVLLGLSPDIKAIKIGRSPDSDIKIDLSKPKVDLTQEVARPDYFIHLAAVVPGCNNIRDDHFSATLTTIIDENVFHACKQWECPVIYASGCSLYEPKASQAIIESDPLRKDIQSPYLHAKKIGDVVFRTLSKSCVLRVSCPVGQGLSSTNVIGNFLKQVENYNQINVYGTGKREQDFIDVRDISSLINIVIEKEAKGIYNVSSGKPISMKALADLIVKLKGRGDVLVGRVNDPLEGVCAKYSVNEAIESLGWKPKYGLQEMLLDQKLL